MCVFVFLFKDPFPVIESIKTNKSEIHLSKKILKLQSENKTLRERLEAASGVGGGADGVSGAGGGGDSMAPTKQQNQQQKEIILKLTDKVTKATSLNLELTSKLKISEGEIESYKKLLSDYQNELFEMKNKHINEVKSHTHTHTYAIYFYKPYFYFSILLD